MAAEAQPDMSAFWRWVTDQVKAQITLPSLWRAMEAAVPITIDGDEMVVGFPVNEAHQAGMLTSGQHQRAIEALLEKGAKRRLRLTIISGETLEEWEATKRMQVEASRLQEEHRQEHLRRTGSAASWDNVGEQLVRRYSALPHRSLSSVQAGYLEEAIGVLVEAYPRLMPDSPSELDERNYTRCLDRVAERAGVPGSLLGWLVAQRRNG